MTGMLDLLEMRYRVDRDYRPAKDSRSMRILVDTASITVELVLTGPAWFDTRAQLGGRGCIDLCMHLHELSCGKAMAMLAAQLQRSCDRATEGLGQHRSVPFNPLERI